MYKDGTCPSTVAADGTVTREACPDGYGMVLGEFHSAPVNTLETKFALSET